MNGWLIQQLINNTNYRQFLTCNIMQCTTVKLLCWPFHSRFQLVWKTYICLWSAKMINWCTYCCGSFLQIGNSSCGKWNMATFHPVGLGWGVVSNVHFMTWSSFLELMSSWHMQKIFHYFMFQVFGNPHQQWQRTDKRWVFNKKIKFRIMQHYS